MKFGVVHKELLQYVRNQLIRNLMEREWISKWTTKTNH